MALLPTPAAPVQNRQTVPIAAIEAVPSPRHSALPRVPSVGHPSLTVSTPVLANAIFPPEQFQEGVKVAVNRLEAVPDGPDAPLGKVGLCVGGLGGVLLRGFLGAVPQAQGQAQNRCLQEQPHPAARTQAPRPHAR